MPNTREKLIELLQSSPMDVFGHRGVGSLADHLIANGVTVQEQLRDHYWATEQAYKNGYKKGKADALQWIPVTERLPKNDYGKHWKERKYYLVRFAPSGLMCVAHYGYKEYGWWIDEHDCVLSATNFKEVTHWMEISNLPQPPKG